MAAVRMISGANLKASGLPRKACAMLGNGKPPTTCPRYVSSVAAEIQRLERGKRTSDEGDMLSVLSDWRADFRSKHGQHQRNGDDTEESDDDDEDDDGDDGDILGGRRKPNGSGSSLSPRAAAAAAASAARADAAAAEMGAALRRGAEVRVGQMVLILAPVRSALQLSVLSTHHNSQLWIAHEA